MSYIADIDADNPLASLQAASCTYRIAGCARWTEGAEFANGARAGRENHVGPVRRSARLQPACRSALWCASTQGTRTAVSLYHASRMSPTNGSRARALVMLVLRLKSAWRDGTTHIKMSPLEFMQRLAALVPRPRLHLIRFHGVLAPHARLRAAIVPGPPEKPGADAAPRAHEAPARMGLSGVAQARVRYRPRTLPAVWRRLQDHRRHRRACGDYQDPHAPGLACARAAALPGAAAGAVPGGLILKPTAVAQRSRRSGSASRSRKAFRLRRSEASRTDEKLE